MAKLFNLGLFDEQMDDLLVEENTVCDVLRLPLGDIDEVYFNDTPTNWNELINVCDFTRERMTLTEILQEGITTDTAFYGLLSDGRYLVFNPNYNVALNIEEK